MDYLDIKEYTNILKNSNDEMLISNILSSLDHRLVKVSKHKRLLAVLNFKETDLENIDHETQVLIAAIIEYIYNENNKPTQGMWFMSDKYKLDSIMDNQFLKYFNTEEQKIKQAEIAIKTAAPELKWRNMVGDKVLDAF